MPRGLALMRGDPLSRAWLMPVVRRCFPAFRHPTARVDDRFWVGVYRI